MTTRSNTGLAAMSGAEASQRDHTAYWLWDVVECSRGGHERRRRLAWRMTEEQALEWESAHGGKLRRVNESEAPQDANYDPRRRARGTRNDASAE
jgi:hypothetical protein